MGNTIIWLIVAVLLGIVEGLTVSLISIWMAVGAIAAAIVAANGGSILVQIITFLVLSALLLLCTVPFSKRFREKSTTGTNADRLLGAEGVVLVKIEPIENLGQVKVMGQIWSATSFDHTVIEVGQKVTVEAIEGVKVIVKPTK